MTRSDRERLEAANLLSTCLAKCLGLLLSTPVGEPEEAAPAPVPVSAAPAIGQPWPGQGGTYAGVCRGRDGQPDHHLILAETKTELQWDAAQAWAAALEVDGHRDFHVPTRFESAVLFGNVGDLFDAEWHWTSTQYSATSAWSQLFSYGDQVNYVKKYERRVRAVRRLPVDPSILRTDEGAAS